jgi:hypothetical protein
MAKASPDASRWLPGVLAGPAKGGTMSSALERLAELVRQAESRTRAQKLGAETHQAAERLEVAEARMRQADRMVHEIRPSRLRDLEKAEADEALLKEFTKKLAHSLGSLDPEQQKAAEREIATAREEITTLRREAQAELDAVAKEADAARRELRAARDQYQALRKELDTLLPHLSGEFAEDDRLAREAENYFPAGQIQALAREIDSGERHFDVLDQREQFAQLKIWIGRYRRLQAWVESGDAIGLTDEDTAQLREIFPRLVGISKQYMPGYIEAFSRAFETDWDAYIAEASEQLRLAADSSRQSREAEQRRREQMAREAEQRQRAREAAQVDFDELKHVLARYHLPDEGVEQFLTTLGKVVAGMGTADPQLLDLVRPYAELLTGKEFRALRRNLERLDPDQARQEEIEAQREQFQDLVAATRGRRAVMIGGDVREEKRKSLQQIFEFDSLEWVPYEKARPAMLSSLEQRVANRGMDLVLILKEFVGHHVSERLRPLCEEYDIPCLMVDHGYGAAQVAEAIRKGLPKLTVGADATRDDGPR